jgi:hypothetical protein
MLVKILKIQLKKLIKKVIFEDSSERFGDLGDLHLETPNYLHLIAKIFANKIFTGKSAKFQL